MHFRFGVFIFFTNCSLSELDEYTEYFVFVVF